MNDKFEKWWEESDMKRDVYLDIVTKAISEKAWQAAIESLEVTKELVVLACEEYESDNLPFDEYSNTHGMKEAVTAVLSALKEQAK